MKTKQVIIISILTFMFCPGSVAQTANVSRERELYFVDTIEIKDPILVRFKETGHFNSVLVSKESLNYMRKGDTSYVNFLSTGSGYLFFQPVEFSCLVDNLLYYNRELMGSRFYARLNKKLLGNPGEKIYTPTGVGKFDKLPEHNGWEYSEIYPRKFLLFLAKGNAVNRCTGRGEIRIDNMDNLYFKVLCPIMW